VPLVATWQDVERLCRSLPDAVAGEAHDGSRAWYAGRHQFVRQRSDEQGRDLVQVWTGDLDTAQALAGRRKTFPVIHTHRFRVSLWALLVELDVRELAELVLDSYAIRGGPRRGAAVDTTAYFGD
jgi:hypothetical protein